MNPGQFKQRAPENEVFIAYIMANPGCTYAELGSAMGITHQGIRTRYPQWVEYVEMINRKGICRFYPLGSEFIAQHKGKVFTPPKKPVQSPTEPLRLVKTDTDHNGRYAFPIQEYMR